MPRYEEMRQEETGAAYVNQLPTVSGLGTSMLAPPEETDDSLGKTMTAEEKEAEKVRLQQLVNAFVRNAAKGCPCTYLKEVSGERSVTRYFLDKRLEHLVVVAAHDTTVAEVRCPIGAIQDIYCLTEDGVGVFPAKVVQPLTQEEQQLLLMVVYRSDRGGTHRFCLLLDTPDSRDNFLECLRILCIYTQSLQSAGTSPPPPG